MTLTSREEHLGTELLERIADDFYGLWELIGILSAARASTVSRDEARRIVRQLYGDGALLIVWGHPNPVASEPLTLSELERVLETDTFWSSDQLFAGNQVWLSATDLNVPQNRETSPRLDGDLSVGLTFTFRPFPRWQFWRRREAVAYVIDVGDDGIVHLLIRGAGPFVIRHLPILQSQATPEVRDILSSGADGVKGGSDLRAPVESWRLEHARGTAGAFSVSLREAVSLVYETIGAMSADIVIDSAYPVRDHAGDFRTVRVVTAPAAG